MRKNINKITSNNLNIGYSGKVKIDLVKGTKIIKSKEYTNTGNWPIFYFLGLCLSGEYHKAELYRPKYLRLFSAGNAGTDPTGIDINNILSNEDNITSLNLILYNQTPHTSKNETTIESPNGDAETMFKFVVPFTQILNEVNKPTNLFVLYDQTNKDVINTPSTYFLLLNEEGKLDDIFSQEEDLISNDYNLFIQWTINIQNQL